VGQGNFCGVGVDVRVRINWESVVRAFGPRWGVVLAKGVESGL